MDFAETKVNRSIERGMGPTKKAATIDLEAAALTDLPSDSVDLIVIGSMWMLRGDEVAALLIEQAHVDSDVKLARLTLGVARGSSGAPASRRWTGAAPRWAPRCARCTPSSGCLPDGRARATQGSTHFSPAGGGNTFI